MTYKFIDKYDDMGNDLIDNYLVPLSKGVENIVFDNELLIKSYFH